MNRSIRVLVYNKIKVSFLHRDYKCIFIKLLKILCVFIFKLNIAA